MKKLLKLPISGYKRLKNKMGKNAVPCVVSSRWIKFPKKSAGHFKGGEYIDISIMTFDKNDKKRKICDLVVTREELIAAINSVKDPENKT